jgi:hypothetical protein
MRHTHTHSIYTIHTCHTCQLTFIHTTERRCGAICVYIHNAYIPYMPTYFHTHNREKMWGDLRGGKKSVFELRDTPEELTVTMQNPNIALKRKATFENNKDIIKEKVCAHGAHVLPVRMHVYVHVQNTRI